MSRFLNVVTGAALAIALTGPSFAEQFDLGREATSEEVAAWDIDVRPDGLGLPEGKGNVMDGEAIFVENCAVCHGDFGEGAGRWPVLIGGKGSLKNDRPVKTIGSYWPYLSTVFDYINRAMPFGNAQSLTADEVYAITAYILYSNDIVDDEFELNSDNFTSVEMPNEGGFKLDDRPETELAKFSAEACMSDCKPSVKILNRAAKVDVTPEEDAYLDDGAAAQPAETEPVETAEATTTEPVEAATAEPAEATTAEAAAPAAAPAQEALDPELVADGEKNFRKCKACHEIGEGAKNKTGPHLNALLGRPVGGLEDFNYSSAMAEKGAEGVVWNDETLAEFLEKPKAYIKKTKMSFGGFKKEEDLKSIIAYLKSASE